MAHLPEPAAAAAAGGAAFRYFRVRASAGAADVRADLPEAAEEVTWLREWRPDTFFRLPAETRLVAQPAYQRGDIFGLDAASAAAVWAVGTEPGERVLDICCAPGGKMFLLAEQTGSDGVVVGVDVALHRLYTTRALMTKYGVANCVLLHGDAVKSDFADWAPLGKKAETQALPPFDRALVDAECTHDASGRHVAKQKRLHGEFKSPWAAQPAALFELQVSLLLRGIDSVKTGGIVVYSTCTASFEQNERVVAAAIGARSATVVLDPLPFDPLLCLADPRSIPGVDEDPQGRPAACFFDPDRTQTSGLFICRLRKL